RLGRRDSEAERARYRRWGGVVVARPGLVLALALPPLLWVPPPGARHSTPAEPQGSCLPAATESARAEDDLEAMGRRGVLYACRVLVSLPEETQALSVEGWQASRRVAQGRAAGPRA